MICPHHLCAVGLLGLPACYWNYVDSHSHLKRAWGCDKRTDTSTTDWMLMGTLLEDTPIVYVRCV